MTIDEMKARVKEHEELSRLLVELRDAIKVEPDVLELRNEAGGVVFRVYDGEKGWLALYRALFVAMNQETRVIEARLRELES